MHFYIFKALLRAVLLPPAGLIFLAVAGAVLVALRHRRSGWSCLIAGLGLLWLLSVPVVADQLTRLVEVYPPFHPESGRGQAIVILGGGFQRNHAPEYGDEPAAELDLLERLNYGAWLSRQVHLPILVTSDAKNAHAMAVSLTRDFQVAPRWVEDQSQDTYENARNTAFMLRADHVTSILLVTSSDHMLRSVREFAATGLRVTPAPTQVLGQWHRGEAPYRFLPSTEGMMRSNRAIYELIGERARELMAALHLRRQQPG
jgi:uncharacterized SAM-binding protein YcdF (DUF218 family)